MLSFMSMVTWQSLQKGLQRFSRRQWLLVSVVIVTFSGIAWFSLRAMSKIPDFRHYVAGPERKAEFFAFVQPLIEAENDRVRQDRERLVAVAAEDNPDFFDRLWLSSIAREYAIENQDDAALVQNLLVRVDVVPLSLALAQSAKESGWGTSRFARDGYNLFGEWCFEAGCGMVPRARAEGRHHEVADFRSPRHSVASYLNNINTHASYRAFRLARAQLRAQNKKLSGVVLAGELSKYSERRDAYVKEIRQLIRSNKLE